MLLKIKVLGYLSVIILFSGFVGFSQTKSISEIEQNKLRLETLQKQLWQIDSEQFEIIKKLQNTSLQKDEFETTKQFEKRHILENERITIISEEIDTQSGEKRRLINKEINEILKTEFVGNFRMFLGTYDADSQQFPIFLNDGSKTQEKIFVPLNEARELKENFSLGKVTGNLGLLLNEKNQAKEYIIDAKIIFNSKYYQTVSSKLSLSKVMYQLFGNHNPRTQDSTWNAQLFDGERKNLIPTDLNSELWINKQFKQNNLDKQLFLFSTGPNQLYFSAGVILSLSVFVNDNGRWKLEQSYKKMGLYSSYQTTDNPTLVKIGSEKFALKFPWKIVGQGRILVGEDCIEIDGNTKKIFQLETLDTSFEGNDSIEKSASFTPKQNAEYFAVKVKTTAKKSQKIGRRTIIKPFTNTEIYIFVNGKYELSK